MIGRDYRIKPIDRTDSSGFECIGTAFKVIRFRDFLHCNRIQSKYHPVKKDYR